MSCRRKPLPVVKDFAQASTASRACGHMMRVGSRAVLRRLFISIAAPTLLGRSGPLSHPKGVWILMRPSWRQQPAAPLCSAPLPTSVVRRCFNSCSLGQMLPGFNYLGRSAYLIGAVQSPRGNLSDPGVVTPAPGCLVISWE